MNQFSDKRIFVVDDEAGITRLCERFLKRESFHVLTTNYPQDAISILDNQVIDLLLVDIRMPGIDGFQLMKLARQFQPDIAVVIMTGYGTVETAVESLRQGADGLLLKPFSGAELAQSVEQALQNRQRERDMLRLQALRPLFSIAERLFAEKSPELLRERLLEMVTDRLQCSHASFYCRLPNSNDWEQLAVKGKSFDPIRHWPAQYGLVDLKSYSIDELDDPGLKSVLLSNGLGIIFCVPLNSENVQRVLIAARDGVGEKLGEVEMETIRILSRQAIVALENAQLYNELQDQIIQVEESQRALVQAEKMAVVGRLTTSIAHEINNPLHSVRNCLHLARRHELSFNEREEYLDLASDEMERLMNTVRQMLDFYRPSAIDRKPLQIPPLIDGVLKLLESQLIDNHINVRREYAPELPLVLAVENQMQQVFFNLILNAMEAMPSGGNILITSMFDQGNVSIQIEDTGTGILKDQIEDIFEPFVSTKERGLGLGLTVSYGVVTAHGGSLTLLHPIENGACFQISLPAYNKKI